MGWLSDNLHWVLFTCLLVSLLLTAGVGILGVLVGLAALSPEAIAIYGIFVIPRAIEAAFPFLVGTILLLILDVALFVGTVVSLLRRLSMPELPDLSPRSRRLAKAAKRLEREYPVLGAVGVSEKVEPTLEQRREHLKSKYVEGEIGEDEFERRMQDLLDEDESDPLLNSLDAESGSGSGSDATASETATDPDDSESDESLDRGTNIDVE